MSVELLKFIIRAIFSALYIVGMFIFIFSLKKRQCSDVEVGMVILCSIMVPILIASFDLS